MGGANDIVIYCCTVIPKLIRQKCQFFVFENGRHSARHQGETVPAFLVPRRQPFSVPVWLQDHVYTQALHVGYIYLQNFMIFRVNVSRHTIQHLG